MEGIIKEIDIKRKAEDNRDLIAARGQLDAVVRNVLDEFGRPVDIGFLAIYSRKFTSSIHTALLPISLDDVRGLLGEDGLVGRKAVAQLEKMEINDTRVDRIEFANTELYFKKDILGEDGSPIDEARAQRRMEASVWFLLYNNDFSQQRRRDEPFSLVQWKMRTHTQPSSDGSYLPLQMRWGLLDDRRMQHPTIRELNSTLGTPTAAQVANLSKVVLRSAISTRAHHARSVVR